MKTKKKIIIASVFSLLLLTIIGLSIAVALVASNVSVTNSMIVRYQSIGASADVTIYGKNYLTSENTPNEVIQVKTPNKDFQNSITQVFTFGTTTSDHLTFNEATLTASGRSTYFFEIKNTAPVISERILKASITVSNADSANNIKILIGPTEYDVTERSTAVFDVGVGGQTIRPVLTLAVDDPTLEGNFSCEMELILSYDIESPAIEGSISNPLIIGGTNGSQVDANTQLNNAVADTSTLQATRYYSANGSEVSDPNDATMKVESYPTVDIIYGSTTTQNTIGANENGIGTSIIPDSRTSYIVTNKKYIKLKEDIDISQLTYSTDNNVASIELDGDNHTLTIDGANLSADNEYYLFKELYDSTIKNLKINLVNNIGGIVNMPKGTVRFENVTVISSDYVSVEADTNLSAFCRSIKSNGYNDNVEFINCHNNAKLMSTVSYFGLFVGGYGRTNGYVSFKDCSFGGDVITIGSVGILFGNPIHEPMSDYSVENFSISNTASIKYAPSYRSGESTPYNTPHVVVSELQSLSSSSNPFDADDYTKLDNLLTGKTSTLSSNFTAIYPSVSNGSGHYSNGITLKGTLDPNINYQLKLSSRFVEAGVIGEQNNTLLSSIFIDLPIEEQLQRYEFQNVVLPMIDRTTYEENGGTIPTNANWVNIENTNYKYYKTDSCYVLDFNGIYIRDNLRPSTTTWCVFAKDQSGNIVGFSQGGEVEYAAHIVFKADADLLFSSNIKFELSANLKVKFNNTTKVFNLSSLPGVNANKTITFDSKEFGGGHLYFYLNDINNAEELTSLSVDLEITLKITNNSTNNNIRVRAGYFDETLPYIKAGETKTITAKITSEMMQYSAHYIQLSLSLERNR